MPSFAHAHVCLLLTLPAAEGLPFDSTSAFPDVTRGHVRVLRVDHKTLSRLVLHEGVFHNLALV
jgi:hypothetical protein